MSAVQCGHSACVQHYIDTGLTSCVEGDGITALYVQTGPSRAVTAWFFDVAAEAEAAREHLRELGVEFTEATVACTPPTDYVSDASELWLWLSKKVPNR